YEGMHGARATVFPGSGLAQRKPRWIVSAERVATERVYLRTVAQIKPAWVQDAAAHLVRRDYEDPHWDVKRGRVLAREVVTLMGLTLSRDRHVDYARVDRDEARRLFIRHALAEENLGERLACLEHNRRLRDELHRWEAKRRSRDLYAGERAAEAFYAARLPADIASRAALRRWCRDKANARRLEMHVLDIATRDPAEFDRDAYPDRLDIAGHSLPVRYVFEPGSERDGITVRVPEPLVGLLREEVLDWLVPGWARGKALALLRGLPKEMRRPLVPLPDTVEALWPELERARGMKTMRAALADLLAARHGIEAGDALDAVPLPPELRMRIEVVDRDGAVVAATRDLVALQRRFGRGPARRPAPDSEWSRRGVTRWEFPDLPDSVRVEQYGTKLALYPALLDVDGRVDLELIAPGPAAAARHRLGVRRLLLKQLPQQTDVIRRRVLDDRELILSYHGVGSGDELVDDVISAAADEAFDLDAPVRTAAAFDLRLEQGRAEIVPAAERLIELARGVLAEHRILKRRLEREG